MSSFVQVVISQNEPTPLGSVEKWITLNPSHKHDTDFGEIFL